MRKSICGWSCAMLGIALLACEAKVPSIRNIRDSPIFDRRIEETPRQKVMRECSQEAERFRVDCTHCHTTSNADEIMAPDKLLLSKIGRRAQIMRKSSTFGLQRQCSECHQSKFTLTIRAQQLFGPDGSRRKELEELIQGHSIK